MTNTVDTTQTTPGNYFKKSAEGSKRPRIGKAYTTVNQDGTLSYTNRDGKSVTIDFAQFSKKWDEGYCQLNARTLSVALPAMSFTLEDVVSASMEGAEYTVELPPVEISLGEQEIPAEVTEKVEEITELLEPVIEEAPKARRTSSRSRKTSNA